MSTIFEPGEWRRYGRGRGYEFFAIDSDVQQLLNTSLPDKFAPYSLIADFLVEEEDGRFRGSYEEVGVEDFVSQRKKKEKRQRFFIRSHLLSPDLELSGVTDLGLFLYINGLVHVNHVFIHGGSGWSKSRLQIMNKIYNDEREELYLHGDYNKIYNALRRGLKKILRYRSKWTNINEVVDLPHVYMTDAFVEQVRSGKIRTAAVPGDPL